MKVDVSEVEALVERMVTVDAPVWSEAAHEAVVGEYARQRGQIPRDTGALAKAILRRGDRKHRWELVGDRARLIIDLPQAVYQAHRLPTPEPEPIAEAVASAIDDHLSRA